MNDKFAHSTKNAPQDQSKPSTSSWKQVFRMDGDASTSDDTHVDGDVDIRIPTLTPIDMTRVGREVELYRHAILRIAKQRGKQMSPLANQPLSPEPRRAALQIVNAFLQKGMSSEKIIEVLRRWTEKRGYDLCALIDEILPALGGETGWLGDTVDDIDIQALRKATPEPLEVDGWSDSGETLYGDDKLRRQIVKETALLRIDQMNGKQ